MRRQFRLVVIAVGLAIAVATGAAAMVEAVDASGEGPAAGPTARERAREMRLQEAEMQLQAALEALESARHRVEAGVGLSGDVRERELDAMRAKRALVELMAMEVERVSINVKDEKLTAVFTKLFEGTEQSVMLDPAVADIANPVTLTLNDVSLENAVRMICKLYNLEYETDNEGLWVIMPSSGFATVGGARVPIIGTVTTRSGPQGDDTALALLRGIGVSAGGGGGGGTGGRGVAEAPTRPSFLGEERLVDLDVKDAPLSEVASRLSFKAGLLPKEGPLPPGWQDTYYDQEITVDDAVKDLKVTARITKWPVGEVLDMLLAQTGLVCQVQSPHSTAERPFTIRWETVNGERVCTPPRTVRVYIVPAPEMRVSGEGLPSKALVSRYMMFYRGEADKARVLQDSQECPQCHASILLPDWTFCPYCGAEAVAEGGRPEGAD